VTLGDADFRKSPMKMIYRKLPKNSVTTCHLSPLILLIVLPRANRAVDEVSSGNGSTYSLSSSNVLVVFPR